jgi:transcriptional regulator with XRE-family HTH domain
VYFDQEAFEKRLKELRNIKGMTQEELAEKLNISREHLGRIERGKYGCSIDLLIELSCALNASTDYLLLGRNPDRDQDRRQLLQVISQLSDIARNM